MVLWRLAVCAECDSDCHCVRGWVWCLGGGCEFGFMEVSGGLRWCDDVVWVGTEVRGVVDGGMMLMVSWVGVHSGC